MKTRKLEKCEKQPSGQLLNLRLAKMPVTKRELKRELYKDEILAKVIMFMERGWPEKTGIPTELKPFFDKKAELSFEDGILLRQGRIVPPTNLRNRMLATVHEGHPGIVAMKSMARFQVWWPGIDKEIETYVNQCEACQRNRQRPPEVPLLPWNVPAEPWTRIHVDIAGMFMDHYWLVVVDAHSKWLEVIPMKSTTTASVIKRLRKLFATFGLPRAIVSDNGPQFVSEEFEVFCDYNNVTHIKTAPYHPKSNGLAERAVRLFKDRLRASSDSVADVEQKLQRFLFSYRNSLHATTGRTPAELQLGRRLRTKLDLLKPALDFHIDKRLFKQAEYHDRSSRSRSFNVGDRVYVYEPNEAKQEKGVIIERSAENLYLVSYKGKKAGSTRIICDTVLKFLTWNLQHRKSAKAQLEKKSNVSVRNVQISGTSTRPTLSLVHSAVQTSAGQYAKNGSQLGHTMRIWKVQASIKKGGYVVYTSSYEEQRNAEPEGQVEYGGLYGIVCVVVVLSW
uniref:RNA-directed DNA polymerase n=1 Tax=Trichuris muris TaxID=70415 RepID=A0A5S6QTQ4_TRIMR